MQGDVSFTFLDRIEEVELNIVDRRWQSALALALTLPDICGGIAFPEIVKHYRDGRVMLDRQKNLSLSVGKYEHTGERKRYSYRHRTVLSEDVQGSKELL